jgi:2-polyprenyl-3-methyl-5-hydroxy-6-metoxy-1,4-benzoquinol methylase
MAAGDWRGEEWDRWGKQDPYFGVVSHPEYRADRIDKAARERFFRGGEVEMAETLSAVRALTGPDFRPRRALDFGCGVGRLTIPLAREAAQVVGVDVSPAMMAEARANCARAGLTNVEFRQSAPGLPDVEGRFDFVHSYIVFQHIPPSIGYGLFEDLLDRVAEAGAGMLHFTIARRAPLAIRLLHRARRSSMLVHRAMNLVQRRDVDAPLMAIFEYDLDRLLASLRSRGFDRIKTLPTDHGGCIGVRLAFARSR